MSREVRRVPVAWKHPVEPNPHWEYQRAVNLRMSAFDGRLPRPASRLHGPTEKFVSLADNYPGRLTDWERDLRDMKAREGRGWKFSVEWHLTGYNDCTCHEGQTGVKHPYYTWSEDGNTEIEVPLRDEDHLNELEVAKVEQERPDPADYMPVFDVPEDELGWCLYQTVSEGTPVTPVFATAEELIDHLCTVGQDWDQVPMRREAAESLVRSGHSLGSFVAVGGTLYRSDQDADLIENLPKS